MWRLASQTIVFASLLALVFSQSIEDEFYNPCTTVTTCRECIQTSPVCSWCSSEDLPRDFARCDLLANLRGTCNKSEISSPKSTFTVKEDLEYTSGGGDTPPVQVKPQKMEFNIRPNDPVSFKLYFQQQANYPVDLYFLLDLSFGMSREEEAQKRLIALGNSIPESMKTITNNFKLGFGTFVDKTVMPYSAWTPTMLEYRCPLPDKSCRKPHDFWNHFDLGEDQKAFADKMETALLYLSQSLDDAEGGLDGLIQALACDEIGWRNVSRRIIVYSSNSLFHLAGNGKLGGATKQSDLKCDLDAKGHYRGEKIYDYPSVSQVNDKLREKNANVIFAVMQKVSKHYKALENFLDGAVVGELAENSENIVKLIQDKYYELRSKIEFKPMNADDVDIVVKSKCTGGNLKKTYVCDNLEIGKSVEFEVTMTVSKDVCKGKNGAVKKQVLLDAVGLSEQLVLDLNVQCDCQCEGPALEILNSDKCSKAGTLECGICNCNSGRYGRHCECDETQISSAKSLELCRSNQNESTVCSGNGECVCGGCHCFVVPGSTRNKYSGIYCNCNNYDCPLGRNRKPCGGKGECKCSKCYCKPGWSGPNCECTTDKETCMASNGKECNGVGTCKCGRCQCDKSSDRTGPTCEDCPSCPLQCNEYKDCAQCSAHKSGTFGIDECKEKCQNTEVKAVLPSGKGIRECDALDVDGCTFYFTYQYTPENDVIIVAQETKRCPEEANIEAIIGGTVAAVVIIPLFIICLIIFIRNRRYAKEYAEFMKEREKAHWDSASNPIYKDPKSTFQNPTYKGAKN